MNRITAEEHAQMQELEFSPQPLPSSRRLVPIALVARDLPSIFESLAFRANYLISYAHEIQIVHRLANKFSD